MSSLCIIHIDEPKTFTREVFEYIFFLKPQSSVCSWMVAESLNPVHKPPFSLCYIARRKTSNQKIHFIYHLISWSAHTHHTKNSRNYSKFKSEIQMLNCLARLQMKSFEWKTEHWTATVLFLFANGAFIFIITIT